MNGSLCRSCSPAHRPRYNIIDPERCDYDWPRLVVGLTDECDVCGASQAHAEEMLAIDIGRGWIAVVLICCWWEFGH